MNVELRNKYENLHVELENLEPKNELESEVGNLKLGSSVEM